MVHYRNGVLIVVSPKCGNRNCEYCRRERAKRYSKMMTEPIPMILNYKTLPNKDARKLTSECNKTGEYYWKCPMDSEYSVVVTTKPLPKGIPFPTDEDSVEIIEGWISRQGKGNISHTRSSIKKIKSESKWETYFIPKSKESNIKDVLTSSNWTVVNGRFKADSDAVDWAILIKILESVGISVSKKVVKKNNPINHCIITKENTDEELNNLDEIDYQFSFTEDKDA